MVGISPPPSRSGPRLVRVRAEELGPDPDGDPDGPHRSARMAMAARPGICVGDRLELEVSFGPLSDEVVFPAQVVGQNDAGGPPQLVLSVPESDRPRVSYVRQVLAGERQPITRSQRRVQTDRDVAWFRRSGRFEGRLRDISGRGAFISARPLPAMGETVVLHLDDAEGKLVLECQVTWLREQGLRSGFGVSFRLRDRAEAARIAEFVRTCSERAPR